MTTPDMKQARLEARVPTDVHAMLKRAADLEGRTLTDFVVSAATEAARRTIEETEILRLTADDQVRFAEALLAPPELPDALIRARQAHARLIREPL